MSESNIILWEDNFLRPQQHIQASASYWIRVPTCPSLQRISKQAVSEGVNMVGDINSLTRLAIWMRTTHNALFYATITIWRERARVLLVYGHQLDIDPVKRTGPDVMATLIDLDCSAEYCSDRAVAQCA